MGPLLVSLVLLQGAAWAGKTTLYVSPEGNDQWSGRMAEPQQNEGPFATLDAARLKIRKLKAANPDESFEVQFRGGLYSLRETVVFGPEDSGSKDAPVVYKAYPGEEPVFTGGIPVSGWKKLTTYPEGVTEAAKGNLWVADIPQGVSDDWYIRSLYDGEELLHRAISGSFHYQDIEKRYDYNRQGKKIVNMLEYEGEPVEPFDRDVYFREGDLRDWPNLYDVEVKLKDRPWLANFIPIESIDMDKGIARLAADPTYQPNRSHLRYWVENAIDYLDEPGEWVVNTPEGRIYMWPKADIATMNVIAPFLQEFIRVEGEEDGPFVKHIHFEGLTFMHGQRDTMLEGDKGLQHDWEMYDKGNAVIRFRHAEECSVKRSTLKSSSGTGIRLDLHCQQIEIVSNHLKYLGGGGIVLSGYGPGTKDENKNNVVHDNYIHHVGEILWHSPAIFVAQSGNNKITHNTIHDLPYNGIAVSGCRPDEFYLVKRIPFRRAWVSTIRFEECEPYIKKGLASESPVQLSHFLPLLHARENLIAMNDISHVLLKLHDGNAIYFSAMGENNVVENNYLHQNYGTAGTVRLDDNPSFTIIRNNVVRESEQGFGLKGPADLSNNFVFTETFLRGRPLPGWLGGTKQVDPVGNIFMPPASSKSSNGLYLTDKRATDRPFYENLPKMENSIYYTENTSTPYVPKSALGTDLFTGKPVTPGQDDIKLIYTDPMFDKEAALEGIYRFQAGSPAEQLGIKPIDLRGVGSSLTQPHFKGFEETSAAEGEQVLFDFNNKTPFDNVPAGAPMTVDGITMTTIEIVDVDGVTKGGKVNIHAGFNAVGIRSASGKGDHNNIDVGEAWGFTFDSNITSIELKVAEMDESDVFKLTIREGAEDMETDVSLSRMKNGVFTLNQTISAQTPIEIKLIAGDIARIESIAVTPSNR
ncbi:right-handed parallel beta-helix repeat-containing protein [Pontiellaceae bacterium B12219]|nr:right-handed parallel beta-helix repeat-containing protein [Pontiellaceae bacterium B12219]